MPAGYDTNAPAANRRELWRFGRETAADREVIELAGADEAAELRDRALRLLAVGVSDTPRSRCRRAEIARRLAQLEPPAHRWG